MSLLVAALGVWATFRVADRVEALERPAPLVAGVIVGAKTTDYGEQEGQTPVDNTLQVVRLVNSGRSTTTLLPAQAENWAVFDPATGDLVRWADVVLPGGEVRYVVLDSDAISGRVPFIDTLGRSVVVEQIRDGTTAELAIINTLLFQCVKGVAQCATGRPAPPEG